MDKYVRPEDQIIVVEKQKERRKLTPEHLEKIRVSREEYWAKRKALKESMPPAYKPSDDEADLDISSVNKLGRPSKEIVADAREKIIQRIYKKKEKLIDAQIDSATGLYYTANDGKHVYLKKPDTGVGEFLLNQLIGKPKESVEVKSVNLMIDI